MTNLQTGLFDQELVKNINGELLVSSIVIAENINYEHRAILQLIRQNLRDFEEFGRVPFETRISDTNSAFEMRNSKGRATQYALLNENQSTLLITYLRNSELVKRFKINLVKAFAIMKEKLSKSTMQMPTHLETAKMLVNALEKNEKLILENKTLEITNNMLMHTDKLYTVTEIAKELGFPSATILNKKLEDLKIQYKVNNSWVLSSKYSNLGYTSIKQYILENGKVVYDRKFTQKGRDFQKDIKQQESYIIKNNDLLQQGEIYAYRFKHFN